MYNDDLDPELQRIKDQESAFAKKIQAVNIAWDWIDKHGFKAWWRNQTQEPPQSKEIKEKVIENMSIIFLELEEYEKLNYLKENLDYCKQHSIEVPYNTRTFTTNANF